MLAKRFSAALLATYSALCIAQTPQRYTVTGTVTNSVTSEPIRRALVSVNGTLVFTGADGRFQANDIPEGPVTVGAQKPGYFNCTVTDCSPEKAQGAANFTLHSNSSDISLKLVPEAKIQGRIVDESGDPVSNIPVSASSEQIMNGVKEVRQSNGVSTDEDGNYEIADLMPGRYRLQTSPRATFYAYFNLRNAPRFQMYPARYYPGVSDESAAQTLELRGGQTAQADFTLTKVPAFRISGSVSPPGGIYMTAEDSQGQETQLPVRQRGGKFEIPFIPAGTWTIHFFRQMMQENQQFYGEANVTVGPADIENLQIVLRPLPSATVHFTGGSSENVQDANVQLVSRDHEHFMYTGNRPNGAEGPYEITNVRPGRYSVLVWASDACLDTVTSGDVDLTRDDLVVTSASAPEIDVTLRTDCASLEVTPHSLNPSAMTSLLLLPASHAMDPQAMQIINTSFTFRNLSPGDYKVYAFSNIDGLEYRNPEVMRQFSGQEITLSANQQANLSLDVIARGEK